jgi:hypothetical protein
MFVFAGSNELSISEGGTVKLRTYTGFFSTLRGDRRMSEIRSGFRGQAEENV